MHPDMNSFSDILDINTNDQLQVQLIIVPHGNIQYRMQLNGHEILDTTSTHKLDLFSAIHLKCTIFDANAGALEIRLLSVNGIEVLPKYQHLSTPPTAWLDRNGTWEFAMLQPFYPWYHEISGQGWLA